MQFRLPVATLLPILFGLFAITALSWWYMFYLAGSMTMGSMATMEMTTGMEMAGAMSHSWSLSDFIANLTMWAVMMVAMMVPSASPTILFYARLQKDKAGKIKPLPVTLFLTGYLLAWTLFSLGASLLQWGLHEGALLSGAMAINQQWLIALLLLITGIYQWTPLKQACLKHCQSPLGFLMGYWRDNPTGIVRMGWRHGLFCVGCCWLLMLVLFTVGVMNLLWVGLIAGYVLLEKTLPAGQQLSKISSFLLFGAALTIALRAALS